MPFAPAWSLLFLQDMLGIVRELKQQIKLASQLALHARKEKQVGVMWVAQSHTSFAMMMMMMMMMLLPMLTLGGWICFYSLAEAFAPRQSSPPALTSNPRPCSPCFGSQQCLGGGLQHFLLPSLMFEMLIFLVSTPLLVFLSHTVH